MRKNILFVVIDTSRADVVSDLLDDGHLPNIQSLADSGIRYQNAITPSPWTFPSHANMFTGRYASDHGAHAGNKYFDPDSPTLAEVLSNAGLRTVALSGNIWVTKHFGYGRGFDDFSTKHDRFWGGIGFDALTRGNRSAAETILDVAKSGQISDLAITAANAAYTKYQSKRQHNGGPNTTRRTRSWLRRNGSDNTPFFYFLSYLEPHIEYRPPKRLAKRFLPDVIDYRDAMDVPQESWRYIASDLELSEADFEALRALYKATLVYTDEQVGGLIEELEDQGIRDETTIIVAGDHGENIGDHGLMDHQYSLYETLINVPLIISGPDTSPQTVSDIVELRDLYPTILDLADVEVPEHEGISENSLINGDTRDAAISEYLAPQPSIDSLVDKFGEIQSDRRLDRTYRSVRTNEWKLIEASDGEVELFNIRDDPNEVEECSSDHPNQVETLIDELDSRGAKLSEGKSGDIIADQGTQQRLADLGYI